MPASVGLTTTDSTERAFTEFPSVYYAGTYVMRVLINVYRGANGSDKLECWHLPIAPIIPVNADQSTV
jgi:hypothetical protein